MERFKPRAAPFESPTTLASHSRLRAAPIASVGGRYERMREVLLVYLSPILLDSVLERALKARGLTAATLTEAELGEVASDIMVGLRLFVDDARLPQLMLQLADVLGGLDE